MTTNPTGAMVMCAHCNKRPTFTVDATCIDCRNKNAKEKKPSAEVTR